MQVSVSPQVIELLTRRFGAMIPAGAGAWSTAFRFKRDGESLIVRVGQHVADFEVDREMSAYRSDDLPVPLVYELEALGEPHDGLHICVSTFAPGRPLETAPANVWKELVSPVTDLLDSMRQVSPPKSQNVHRWPEVLLGNSDESDDEGTIEKVEQADNRLDGWRQKLGAMPEHFDVYNQLIARLHGLTERPNVAEVEPTLLHCDLVNRNVHVQGTSITGVFDWGCRRWGDHLYDLAWFEFWAPWYPELDTQLLWDATAERWGETPDPDRVEACLVHIAADHLVYNAIIGEPAGGLEIISRANALKLL